MEVNRQNSISTFKQPIFADEVELYFDMCLMPECSLPEEFQSGYLLSDVFEPRLRLKMVVRNIEVRTKYDEEEEIYEENLYYQRSIISNKVSTIIAEQYDLQFVTKPIESFSKLINIDFNVLVGESNSNEFVVDTLLGILDPNIDDFIFEDEQKVI